MGKRFDATSKQLIESHPRDWLAFAGLPIADVVSVADADLSTFTTAADKVIRVDGPEPYIAHVELQSGWDAHLDRRVLVYNVLAWHRHGLPVSSVVILLRPEALSGATGGVERRTGPSDLLSFRYRLLRLWEQPVEAALQGGLGTLPLAPLCAVDPGRLPAVLETMERRLAEEAEPTEAGELRTAAYILMGIRYPRDMVDHLLKGARNMKDSVTYQAILEEGMEKGMEKGRIDGERAVLIRLGSRKFGPPNPTVSEALGAVNDLGELDNLAERLLEASSWEELLSQRG